MTKWVCKSDLSKYELRRIETAPSFVPAWAKCDDIGLMEVTISEPVRDCLTGEYLGREFYDYYPRDFLMPGETQYGPEQALNWGFDFYDEGLTYTEKDKWEVRHGCFRSAELLYFHAALADWPGNAVAWRCLGYVYEYDRTDGNLWPLWMDEVPKNWHEVLQMKDRKKRAKRCYEIAMEKGDVEAIYKSGDMHRKGFGCEEDANKAFELYSLAWSKCEDVGPVIFGSVASRLASAFEKGKGCLPDLNKSKEFYQKAIVGLEITQNDTSLYDGVLERCRQGLKRVEQELGMS